jgi:cell division protease FtsH
LLTDNIDKLHTMADALMEFETLSADQLDDIMAGGKPRHPTEPPSNSGRGKTDTEQGSPIGGPAEET